MGIAIVNSGFGGARPGEGDGGAIPRERVRKLAAGRRSVRRRRRARAPGVRWAYFLRLNIRVLIFLLSGLVLSRLFRTNLTVTVGYYGDRCAAAPRAESSPKLSGQGGLGGTSTTKVGPAWATRQNIIFVVSRVLELHSPQSIDPGSSPSVVPGIMPCWRCSDELVNDSRHIKFLWPRWELFAADRQGDEACANPRSVPWLPGQVLCVGLA